MDCSDSCLQNHVELRHQGDALPFRGHKRLATWLNPGLTGNVGLPWQSSLTAAHRSLHKYIFASYIQQFYFQLSFIQQNKSAATLWMPLAFRNIISKLKKKNHSLSTVLCWVMISFHNGTPDILVFTKVRTSSAFRSAFSLSLCHLESCL